MGYAVEGAQRMHTMIGDLLKYSRVERQDVEGTATDGEGVLEQVMHDLRLTIAESGAVVTHDPLPTVVTVPGGIVNLFARTQYQDKREAVSPLSSLQAASPVVVMSCQIWNLFPIS